MSAKSFNEIRSVSVRLESEISATFRCKLAANSLDIDVKKKSIHELNLKNIQFPEYWNIGLVYGASGSGKTTLIKNIFGNDVFKTSIDENKSILDQLPEHLTYDECATMLTGIGLNSVPCWIRPVKTLSNGQKARAEAVLLMNSPESIVCIDEWTSVVDRTVAKAMSLCIHKYAKRNKKRIILCSCHYDIIEWLKPDWLIDCNIQEFILPKSKDFFFTEREELKFEIREIGRESWRYFSKYHYLSNVLPAGRIFTYGLFHGDNQIGFQCFANYVPIKKGMVPIYHFNRTVIHPDYNGMGLGIKLINETSKLMKRRMNCRIMGKFSSMPVFKSMVKDPNWKFLGELRIMGRMIFGGSIGKKSGWRDKGVRTFQFEFMFK